MPLHCQDLSQIFQNNGSRHTIKTERNLCDDRTCLCVKPAVVTSIELEDKTLYKIKTKSVPGVYL